MLRGNISTDGTPNRFNISRAHIWEGIRRGVLRSTFQRTSPMTVVFTDSVGTAEGAVDEGGPRREMLQLAMNYLRTDSHLFIGRSGHKHINPLQQGKTSLC